MFTVNTSGNLADTSEIPRLLSQQISTAVHAHPSNESRRLYRISIPLPSVNLMQWLEVQPQDSKIYWSSRARDTAIATAGIADRHTGETIDDYASVLGSIRQTLAAHEGAARYFGGFRFQPTRPTEPMWQPFGAYQFILPRFEIHERNDHAVLFCNVVLPEGRSRLSSILAEVDRLRFPDVSSAVDLPSPTHRSNTPEHDAWNSNVERVLNRITASSLEKAVLARRTTFDLGDPLEAVHLLRQLREHTPACFHFLVQTSPGTAFVGASPERLYRRSGQQLETEAVAGTRPRGETEEQDRTFAHDLSNSRKDFHEHRFVRQYIREVIAPLCRSLEEDEGLSIMKLATKQHLVSRFRGQLLSSNADAQLLEALHPTPAVAGYPGPDALATISSLESFDRGWYAAPVGWVSADAAEFAVAIRSGLIENRHLHLYAGAGIVEGSDPDGEWNELEQKISDFVQLLTTVPTHT